MRFKIVSCAPAVVLLYTLSLCAGGHQADKAAVTPPRAIGTHMKAQGIRNFGQVTPNLYRGAEPSAEGIATLKKMGVDIDVDLRGEPSQTEKAEATHQGMQYLSIPSHCQCPKDEPFARFLKVIQDNPGKKIFVHCQLGKDRTGMAVAAYRMADEGWPAEDAMKEMQAFGFSAMHHVTCPGLAGGYEKKFPERLKESPAFRELREGAASK